MSKFSIFDLEVGMKVKFYDDAVDVCYWDDWSVPVMKCHLGEVCTVTHIDSRNNKFWIKEDKRGFFWMPDVIEEIIDNNEFSESDLSLSSLFEVM